jgi:hypothetical protein
MQIAGTLADIPPGVLAQLYQRLFSGGERAGQPLQRGRLPNVLGCAESEVFFAGGIEILLCWWGGGRGATLLKPLTIQPATWSSIQSGADSPKELSEPDRQAVRLREHDLELKLSTVRSRNRVPEVQEEPDRILILGQDQTPESRDSHFKRSRGQALEKHASQTQPLPAVRHHDSRLSNIIADAHVAGDACTGTADRLDRHERFTVVVVKLCQEGEPRLIHLANRREKAPVARLGAQLREQPRQQGLVTRIDRADQHPQPVPKLDVRRWHKSVAYFFWQGVGGARPLLSSTLLL